MRMRPRRYYGVTLQKQYEKGRVCAGDNCTARLSIYNGDHLCASCDDALVPA